MAAPFVAALALALAFAVVACGLSGCATSQQTTNAEGLADGTYEVAVSLEGGTGRASVVSPATLQVEDGAMTLEVVWSSSYYDKMTVSGVDYAPVTTDGGSTFEIPIDQLNADLAIQAETLAMSDPHTIEYTLHVGGVGDGAGEDASADEGDAAATTVSDDFRDTDIGCGWEVSGSLRLDVAQRFSVDYFEGGYKLICLASGERYLVVPEGASVPDGLADDVAVLQQPLSNIYLVASDTMCLFDALGVVDRVGISGVEASDWSVASAVAAMEDGSIVYGGKYNAPDYELIRSRGCSFAIESTMINHNPEVKEKLEELGVVVLTELSSYEPEPLGRTEWVKLYGALFNCEDAAQAVFDEQAEMLAGVQGQDTGKTVAFFYVNTNGAAVVRMPGDYVTRIIELAGGEYIFTSLDETGQGTSAVTLEMEQFYAQACDADVIIYNATIDTDVDSLADLLAKNDLLANFKAVQNGEVWVTSANMYQQMVQTGQIASDFHAAIAGEDDSGLTFVSRLR